MAEEELDTGLRERLQALAAAEQDALPERARARVVDAVRRDTRQRRVRKIGAGVCAAIAAAAGVALWLAPATPAPDAATPTAHAPTVKADECALVQAARGVRFEASRGGGRSLVVAGHLRVVATSGASATRMLVEPCTVAIDLQAGRGAVQARDLKGGELRVRTTHGDVVVRGTTFSVNASEDALAVELVEGSVQVERARRAALTLAAGEALVARGQTVTRTPLTAQARATLLAQLAADAPTPAASAEQVAAPQEPAAPEQPEAAPNAQAPPPAESLLARADGARRDGRVADARRLYRKAGGQRGPAAEAAWLRLARMEMERGRERAARAALDAHGRRFASGVLAAEASWIHVQLVQHKGEDAATRAAAKALIRAHPKSPQARAARRLLRNAGVGDP